MIDWGLGVYHSTPTLGLEHYSDDSNDIIIDFGLGGYHSTLTSGPEGILVLRNPASGGLVQLERAQSIWCYTLRAPNP